jgi:hypothetical protein
MPCEEGHIPFRREKSPTFPAGEAGNLTGSVSPSSFPNLTTAFGRENSKSGHLRTSGTDATPSVVRKFLFNQSLMYGSPS